MSKENKHKKLVPELRFPDFEKDGNWESKTIEANIDLFSGIALKSKELTNDNTGIPILRGINITEGEIRHSQEMDKFYLGDTSEMDKYLVEENDIVIGMDGSKVGKNVALISKKDAGSILIQRVARIRAVDLEIEYLYQCFLSKQFRNYVDKVNTSSGIPHISSKQIKNYTIGFPPTLCEQQKIAATLTSLDNLITAENEKLEALQARKKGLLQQFFPAKGETVPKVRFGEFSGEWEETILGDKLLQKPEYGMNAPSVPYSEKLPTYLRITDISKDGKFLSKAKVSIDRDVNDDNYLFEDDIALARTGASVGKSYKYRSKDGKLVFAGFLIRVRPNPEKIDSELLFQFLSTVQYWNWVSAVSARSGQPGINGSQYSNMPILLPPSIQEQQKIAKALSSLDHLIASQSEKIEALKEHKKGLMQQMFP